MGFNGPGPGEDHHYIINNTTYPGTPELYIWRPFAAIIFVFYTLAVSGKVFNYVYTACKNRCTTESYGTLKETLSSSILDPSCTICLEPMDSNILVLECGHPFHQGCITDWFKNKEEKTCPICRDETIPKKSCC